MLGAVALDHGRQLQGIAAFGAERQADQATAVFGHEVDGFRRHLVGGKDDIALVLTVLIINEHHHAAGSDFFEQFGDGGKGGLGHGGTSRKNHLLSGGICSQEQPKNDPQRAQQHAATQPIG